MTFRPSADGPDVSHYQHITDESAIPAFGVASCKIAEGRSYFDPTSPKWLATFGRRRVRRIGVYFWLRGDSPIEVQFANLVARLKQVGLDVGGHLRAGYFIQLDWETTPEVRNLTYAEVELFLALCVGRYGNRHITYGSDWVPDFVKWRQRNPHEPVWYANYNLSDKPTGGLAESLRYNATVLQWTSSYKGDGIASGTPGKPETNRGYDMNHVFDWPTLDRLCLIGAQTAPIPVTPPPIVLPPVVVPTPVQVQAGDDMPSIAVNKDYYADKGIGEQRFEFVRDHAGKLRYVPLADHELRGVAPTMPPVSDADLLKMGPWSPPPAAPVVLPDVRVDLGRLTVTSTITAA